MRFTELRLSEPIVRAVAKEGYTTPTPIQTKAIPPVLSGKDVLGCAQTGTGKTGAFALPILHTLAASNDRAGRGRSPRVLVLAPTRELATQIRESFDAYGRYLKLESTVIFGGVGQAPQVRHLRAGVDIVVATPGRLLDLIGQRCIDLRSIEVLVLDEADRMLDMGFIRDIRKIVEQIPAKRQTLLFSATMPDEIRRLAKSILDQPVYVEVAPVAATTEAITESLYLVSRKDKPGLLESLLRQDGLGRTLVFTRTKHGADRLVRVLGRSGLSAGAIHGNKSQNARTRALDGFKSGRMPVLIATDIASRGIDVDDVTHVVNYDIPNIPETYVHRIGRTARAGAKGEAFSFCDHEELADLRAIERLIDRKLNVVRNDLNVSTDEPVAPRSRRGGRGGHTSTSKRSGYGARSTGTQRRRPRRRSGRNRSSAA